MNNRPPFTPKRLFEYVKRYRWRMALGVIAICSTNVMRLISPIILGRAIDALRTEVTQERLLSYAGLLVLISFVQGIIVFAQRRAIAVTSFRIANDIRNDLYSDLLRLPASFYEANKTGDLM